jgi:PUA domain protein
MHKRSLPKREVRDLNSNLSFFQLDIKATIEVVEDTRGTIILQEGEPVLLLHQDKWFPTLQTLNKSNQLKKITVDMGAIPFVCSGADVMRPGIKNVEDGIAKDAPVVVIDEKYGKLLAVGISLFGSEEMKKMERGKVVKNLHYVGDWIWNFNKAME